jgi:hypothetical protein
MKTTYNNLIVTFDREFIEGSPIKWYGSACTKNECLLCEGGETLMEMCHALYNRVTAYNNGEYEF